MALSPGTPLAALAVLLCSALLHAQPQTALRAGMVIDRSVTIRPGTYRLASAGLDTPVIVIRGRDVVLDLAGVDLIGSADTVAPDGFAGLAILVDGGERITIRNARIRGYKVGILARNVTGLRLTGNDVSHNWKQRLYSRVEKESLVDWMSDHDNETNECGDKPANECGDKPLGFVDQHDALSIPAAFDAVLKGEPVARASTDRLDYLSSRAIADGVPNDHVALVACAEVDLPRGRYELRTISDDGVRVWVDGKLAIDHWSTHESAVDRTPIESGRRRLRVEYYERTGFAELRVEIVKRD